MIYQSNSYAYAFFLQLSADLSFATGAAPAVQISKAGAAFAPASGVVSEIGLGWYKCVLTTVDTNTLGDLAIVVTASLCDAVYAKEQIFDQDGLLKRDMSLVSGEASRSPLNALRAIRNKVARVGSNLTVYKEDDTIAAWTAVIATGAAAVPIITVDPA
jgi:hypothetical protein